MAIKHAEGQSQAPPFRRPRVDISKPLPPGDGNILTLPDLVEFGARFNAEHVFCLQYGHNVRLAPRAITHGELQQAVLRFSAWLALQGLAQSPRVVDGAVVKARPVAMLMASDVTWFIAFVSLLRLGVPVCRSVSWNDWLSYISS